MKSFLSLCLWLVVCLCPVLARARSPAEMISGFRAQHGEGRVTTDATLTRIAHDQAAAMAAKDQLDHSVLGSFNARVNPAGAGRAAENIAYGYDNFRKHSTSGSIRRAPAKPAAAQRLARRRRQRESSSTAAPIGPW
jgi:uncharacterized protein YkwD